MSSIEERLREERHRLGFNQEAFAALAGASKRVQAKWEKGETAPTATVLAAFAEAGADALYIVTGRRNSDVESVERAIQLDEELASLHSALLDVQSESKRRDLTPSDLIETVRERLTAIALDPQAPLEARESADDLLRQEFRDEDAKSRRAARFALIAERQDACRRDLDDVLDGMGVMIDNTAIDHLVAVMLSHNIEGKTLVPFLSALRKSLRADA